MQKSPQGPAGGGSPRICPPRRDRLLGAGRGAPPAERYRNAIYLHYFEGYTAAEIAEMMGGTVNTALSGFGGPGELRKRMIGGFEDE